MQIVYMRPNRQRITVYIENRADLNIVYFVIIIFIKVGKRNNNIVIVSVTSDRNIIIARVPADRYNTCIVTSYDKLTV